MDFSKKQDEPESKRVKTDFDTKHSEDLKADASNKTEEMVVGEFLKVELHNFLDLVLAKPES